MKPRDVKIALAVWYLVPAVYFGGLTFVAASVKALTGAAAGSTVELWAVSGAGPYLALNCVFSAASGVLVLIDAHQAARGCTLLLWVLLGLMALDAYRMALSFDPGHWSSLFTLAFPAFVLHVCLYYFLLMSERWVRSSG